MGNVHAPFGMDTTHRQFDAPPTSASSLTPWNSNEHQSSVNSVDWKEPCMPEFLLTDKKEDEISLKLPVTKSGHQWRQLFSQDYYSVGLSPNCRLAFVLGKRFLRIYHLSGPPDLRAEPRDPLEGDFEDAVLSNRYLVAVQRYTLNTFELSADGHRLNKPHSTPLENQNNRRDWIPKCLAISDNGESAWIAVGFRVKNAFGSCGEIKIYLINSSRGGHEERSRLTIENSRKSDHVRRIAFSPDGNRLACVTTTNRVLIWSWSERTHSWQRPFQIQRDFSPVS